MTRHLMLLMQMNELIKKLYSTLKAYKSVLNLQRLAEKLKLKQIR